MPARDPACAASSRKCCRYPLAVPHALDRPRFERGDALQRLRSTDFDVLVVGGGITGAGVALDAASRGLRTALVERDDFASGTSSRSSKLVHGGLRYLDQREFRLVYEALAERQRIIENAPHLVSILPFLVPVLTQRRSHRPPPRARARQRAVDVRPHRWPAHRQAPPQDHRRRGTRPLPHLRPRPSSKARYVYYDAHADDARLTLTIARTAAVVRRGGRELRRGGRRSNDTMDASSAPGSVPMRDETTDPRARGRQRDRRVGRRRARPRRGCAPGVDPTGQGRAHHAAVVERCATTPPRSCLPPDDERIGLRDPVGRAHLRRHHRHRLRRARSTTRRCTDDDVQYLLDALNGVTTVRRHARRRRRHVGRAAPAAPPRRHARTADLSRRHARAGRRRAASSPSTGGKLTTYRRMAADAVDAAGAGCSTPAYAQSATQHLRLARAPTAIETPRRSRPCRRSTATTSPAARYGSEAAAVEALSRGDARRSASRSCPGSRTSRPRRCYAVRQEMARTLDDVLSRRTRARILDRVTRRSTPRRLSPRSSHPSSGWTARRARRRGVATTARRRRGLRVTVPRPRRVLGVIAAVTLVTSRWSRRSGATTTTAAARQRRSRRPPPRGRRSRRSTPSIAWATATTAASAARSPCPSTGRKPSVDRHRAPRDDPAPRVVARGADRRAAS